MKTQIIEYFDSFKNNFESMDISFNEKIPGNKIQFDVVFKNNDNLIFAGLISKSKKVDTDFIYSMHEKYKSDSISVYLFYPLINVIYDLNLLNIINKPFYDKDELVKFIKEKYPETKKENDIIDDLKNKLKLQEDDFNNQLEKFKDKEAKKIMELEKEIKFINSLLDSERQEKKELKNLIKKVENDLIYKLKRKLQKVNFISLSYKIKLELKSSITHKEIATPTGYYKEIVSISNNSTEMFFTIYKNDLYCQIKIYDYHSQGPVDLGASVYSHSLYYILDEQLKRFVQEEKIDFDIWISKFKFTD